jgi:hypothetical protein
MPKHILALPNIVLHVLVMPIIDLGIFFEKKVGLDQGKQGKKKKKKQPNLLLYYSKDPFFISSLPINVHFNLQDWFDGYWLTNFVQ